MAVSGRASPRATHPARTRPLARRALALPFLVVLVGGLTLTSAGADLAAQPLQLTPEVARERGLGIAFRVTPQLGEQILTLDLPHDGPADPRRLLASSAAGDLVAVADAIGPNATELVLVRADGAQLRISVAGALAATFSADATWLAAIDGNGSLQRVSTADGTIRHIADGPFLGQPLVLPDGGIVTLSVASVEAPFTSAAVRVDPASGALTPLSDEALVYAVSDMRDGAMALVAHRPDGSRVLRMDGQAVEELAHLEPGAVHVAVAADGSTVAWEHAGEVFVQGDHGPPRRLAAGSRPRFASDGRALLVDGAEGPLLLTVDGHAARPLASSAAAFVTCEAECAP